MGFAVSNVDFLESNGITDENLMIGQIPAHLRQRSEGAVHVEEENAIPPVFRIFTTVFFKEKYGCINTITM